MPCDTINTVSLDLGKHDPDLMFKALEALGKQPQKAGDVIRFQHNGYTCTLSKSGNLDMRGPAGRSYADDVNAIKRGYSAEIVKASAKKFGYTVTQDAKDKNKLHLKARGR